MWYIFFFFFLMFVAFRQMWKIKSNKNTMKYENYRNVETLNSFRSSSSSSSYISNPEMTMAIGNLGFFFWIFSPDNYHYYVYGRWKNFVRNEDKIHTNFKTKWRNWFYQSNNLDHMRILNRKFNKKKKKKNEKMAFVGQRFFFPEFMLFVY